MRRESFVSFAREGEDILPAGECQHCLLARNLGKKRKPSCEGRLLIFNSGINGLLVLGSDAFEPFEHSEHHTHRDEAEDCEDTPGHPLMRESIEHLDTKEDEEVADGCSREPQALAYTLQVFRGNL